MKNPVIPYAIIAVLGVLIIIIVSYVGVNQRAGLVEDNNGEAQEETQEGETANDPEAIYKNSCAACHGDDLSGVSAPELSQIGNKLSEEEIKKVIIEGQGTMPPGLVGNEEADILAEWLAEQK